MAGTIERIFGTEVIDCQYFSAVEVDALLADGSLGRAAAFDGTPSRRGN